MHILAGEFKGRKLLSPPGKSITRPLTGSVKKSLFDTLSGYMGGAVVLDLYCGTGTMGLEALSRGARLCCFAERDRSVVECLRQNIQSLSAGERSVVWAGDVTHRLPGWLAQLDAAADVVFVDPPYADTRQWDWPQVERTIFAPLAGKLAADGLVVLRTPGGVEVPQKLGGLAVYRTRTYGDMTVTYYGLPEQEQAPPAPEL